MVENLLPSLVTSPPDIETLRLYLILPFYHEFDNPKNYSVLHNPFGRTFLNLKTEAGKVVGEYFISYFETFSLPLWTAIGMYVVLFFFIHLALTETTYTAYSQEMIFCFFYYKC